MKFYQTFLLFMIAVASMASCERLHNIDDHLNKGAIHGQDTP